MAVDEVSLDRVLRFGVGAAICPRPGSSAEEALSVLYAGALVGLTHFSIAHPSALPSITYGFWL